MKDLATLPFVREQKTFEARIAAAVISQATEDLMLFEEPGEPTNNTMRRDRKRLRLAQEDAERFFDNGTSGRTEGLQFWLDVISPKPDTTPVLAKRKHFRALMAERKARYDAAVIARTTGQLADYPPEVAVEAYRRVIEERWLKFYAENCEGMPSRAFTVAERDYWKGLFRATLRPEDVEQEAKDIMFERVAA